jgi:short-subunit dehydrogenase
MPTKRGILIVGSGPGIAIQTAHIFASQGFTHISLISRTQSNLDITSSAITTQHPSVTVSTHACDVSSTPSLSSALASVEISLAGAPEVVLFNAANVTPSTLGTDPASRLIADFSITTAALYTVATTLLPKMTEGKPTLLVTGGHIHHMPFPPFYSLSASKASQFNLSGSLAQVYADVHVGTVIVNGIVEGEEGEMGSRNIAERLWEMYERVDGGRKGEMSVSEVGTIDEFLRKIAVLK